MTRSVKTAAKVAITALLAGGALLGTGAAAQADVPPGWHPGGDGSFEADFGDATWQHQGFYAGVAGNWHTGWINVEEDDDVLHAELVDWKCPAGVTPPAPQSYLPDTACKLKRFQYVEVLDPWDIATFNQKRDRLRLVGTYPALDQNDQPAGTVSFNVTLEGVGTPHETISTADGTLDYEEWWDDARLFGTIDGHGLAGKGTTQLSGRVSYYVESYVRG